MVDRLEELLAMMENEDGDEEEEGTEGRGDALTPGCLLYTSDAADEYLFV